VNVLGGPAVPARHGGFDQRQLARRVGRRDLDAHAPTRELDEAAFGAAHVVAASGSAHSAKLFEGHVVDVYHRPFYVALQRSSSEQTGVSMFKTGVVSLSLLALATFASR